MKRLSLWRNLAIAATISTAFACSKAATVNGRIKGTVSDSAGAVIPKATITATNQLSGVKFTVSSQTDGGYIFQQLPIGTYTITVSAPGFKGFSATGIVLNIDQEYVEPVTLTLGEASDKLTVVADSVQVNTTDMQLDNYVGKEQFNELPLIGRDFTQLELILPGVQASNDRFGTFSVNGSQTQQSSFLINGADSNDLPLNSLSFIPNQDALEQFNLVTGPLNAEYDRNSGGIVSTAVKQGTNKIHGDAFEFYRDTFLNTAGYFQTQFDPTTGAITKTKSPYHEHIFGGTLGGPILKDKLFIFGAYQGQRASTPQLAYGNVQVPSTAQLAGDFSTASFSKVNKIPLSINIPGCTSGVDTYAQCFGPTRLNGQLPATAINPISAKLLSTYVPAANSGPNGYTFNPTQSVKEDQILGRIDYSFREKNQLTFVGIYQTNPTSSTIPFTGATLPGFGEVDLSHNQQYTFDYTRQLGSTAVNDFAIHYTRFDYGAVTPAKTVDPASLGFGITPQNTAAESVPFIGISGYFNLGFSTNGPQPRVDSVYQADDNFSKTIGRHNLKFGYDGRRFNVSNPFNSSNSGNFSFQTGGNKFTSGNALLDFELGIPASYTQGTGAKIIAKAFLNYFYAQDTWKATDALTISYGLGYQIDTPLENLQYGGKGVVCYIPGQQSQVFTTAPKNLNYPGDPGCNNASGAKTFYKDFGPRLGFAYAPNLGILSDGGNKKLSIRGGFGLYYNRTEEETALQNLGDPPFGLTSHGAADYGATNPQFANPFLDLNVAGPQPNNKNKFPVVIPTPGQPVDFSGFFPTELSTASPSFRSPYSENFQLSVERELPSQIVARLSYVGALGRHNQITLEGNPITQAGHDACLADANCIGNSVVQAQLYPTHTAYGYADPVTGFNNFLGVGVIATEAASNYHALQASVDKGTTHGLYVQASYTYAHAMDNGSSFENSGFGENGTRGYNSIVKSLNYGDSAYDARHRFVIAPIYRIPFKTGGNTFSIYNLAAAGWEISGISTFATGFPYDISYGGFGTSNSLYCAIYNSYYACPDVPVQNAPLQHLNVRTKAGDGYTGWFNGETSDVTPGATFDQEPIGSFGNIHRNPYHGPGILNTNVVVSKNVSFSSDGTRYIQLRMESDNVFNHAQFANPDGNITDGAPSAGGTFGQVTGLNTNLPARRTQLGAKIYF